ncbi:MAG: hypothetical protein ACOYUB_05175 [Patescibacteria group bacterium]
MKRYPYLLVFVLLIVLSFILGFRSGQNVEQKNKVVDYLLSITPTPRPPTPSPVKYSEYKSKRWNLKLTYPSGLDITESATAPAIILKSK